MQPAFRQLAPAPPGSPPKPSGSEPPKRKKKARLACDHCRLKRVRCDGGRPDCDRCLRSLVHCVYMSEDADATPTMALKSELENAQRQLQLQSDLIDTLRNAPDDEVLTIVRHLRVTENLAAVHSSRHGRVDGSRHMPQQASARAVMPSTDAGKEFELFMPHPTTCQAFAPPSPSSSASAGWRGSCTQTASSSGTPLPTFQSYPYCDPRLEILTVTHWTRVPIDNGLAARALTHFLHTDHPVLGFFAVDLFVRDLVEQNLHYCSPLLFHSVMSLACQFYSTVDVHITPFAPVFTQEALRLWHADRAPDSSTTLAALNCLAVATACSDRDELANFQIVADARAMATRMQCLDPPAGYPEIEYLPYPNEDKMRDQAHVVWASFG